MASNTSWNDLPQELRNDLRQRRAQNREEQKAHTRMKRELRRQRWPRRRLVSVSRQRPETVRKLKCCERMQFALATVNGELLDQDPSMKWALQEAIRQHYRRLRRRLRRAVRRWPYRTGLKRVLEETAIDD